MSTHPWPFLLAAVCAVPAILGGCGDPQCAEGTIERDGTCVADIAIGDSTCGEGTTLGDDGKCTPEFPPTTCDPDTTIEDTTTIPGMVLCVGVGGPGGCDSDLPCPTASANKLTVCGRLYDVENDQQIRAATPNIMDCGAGGATDGPCSFDIDFYDALDFANDPTGTAPLAVEEFRYDDCGRYVAKNINRPGLPFLGIGVDDGTDGTYRLTGVAIPAGPGGTVHNRQKTYVMRISTDEAWSATAGFGANTFVDRGVFMAVYAVGGVPRAGVSVTVATQVEPAMDYYFSDTEPLLRTMVDPDGPLNDGRTGPNGAGLSLTQSLSDHGGTGAEPAGCSWEHPLGSAIPGVMFFTPRHAVDSQLNECE